MANTIDMYLAPMMNIVDLYNENCHDWTVLTESILFEITPKYSRNENLILHLMVCTNATALEEIPAAKNLEYDAVHLYFVTDVKIESDYNLMQARIKEATEDAYKDLFYRFSNGDLITLFQNNFWENIESKLRGCAREVQRAKNTVVCSYANLDYCGEFIGRRPLHVPSKRKRQYLVRGFAELLFDPNFEKRYIVQRFSDKENLGKFMISPPVHIGWNFHNDCCHYFGADSFPNQHYGNLLQMSTTEITTANWNVPFTLVPYETSIPLFAYSLFSILKPFVRYYPSRMSVNDRYCDVMRKKKIAIFMSLRGSNCDNRRNIANAFCSCFSTYMPEKNSNIDVHSKRKYWSRVHDGVVVDTNNHKNLENFSDKSLLRDACVLCINSDFVPSLNEIAVYTSGVLTDEQTASVSEHIAALVRGFAKYVCDKRNRIVIHELQDSHGQLLKKYNEFYESISYRFRHHFEIAGYKKTLQRWPVERIISLKHLKKFNDELKLCYTKKLKADDRDMPHERSQKRAVQQHYDTFFQNLQAEMNKGWSKLISQYIPIESAKIELADFLGDGFEPKYSLLYASIMVFLDYLRSIGVDDTAISKFREQTLQSFQELCSAQIVGGELGNLFSDYVSSLVIAKQVICIRTARGKDTIGWYDSKKNVIFLSYELFANDFISFCEKKYGGCTHTKKSLLSELISLGIVGSKANGNNSTYQRADIKVVVDPATGEKLQAETVIRLNVECLHLSAGAAEMLSELKQVIVKRR